MGYCLLGCLLSRSCHSIHLKLHRLWLGPTDFLSLPFKPKEGFLNQTYTEHTTTHVYHNTHTLSHTHKGETERDRQWVSESVRVWVSECVCGCGCVIFLCVCVISRITWNISTSTNVLITSVASTSRGWIGVEKSSWKWEWRISPTLHC